MKRLTLKILCLFIVLFLLICLHNASAQSLEIEWPDIPGIQKPETIDTPLSVFFRYIYNLGIILAGSLCFVTAVLGGLKYILAGPRPDRLKEAREQIGFAFLGLMIILGSWMLLNTINPDLTIIGSPELETFDQYMPLPPRSSGQATLNYYEIPVGTLITSEYLASSFLRTEGADINYASTTWPATSTPPAPTTTYATDFQGALYGGRLKRIHEVASTTVPVVKKLASSTEELKELLELCLCTANCPLEAYLCDSKCECSSNHNPCSDKNTEDIENKAEELKHLKKALRAFLNPGSLVKDYYEDNKTEIEDLEDKEIGELIQLMINVERKGDYSPATDPPERDVGTNLSQIVSLLNALKDVKTKLNPLENDINTGKSILHVATMAEATSLENILRTDALISHYQVPFIGLNGSTLTTEKVKVVEDRATFYSSALFGPPQSKPYNQPTEPNYNFLNFLNNIALANSIPDPDDVQYGPEPPIALGGTCDHKTEIPIGTALDEAIKLTQRIQEQLFEIFLKAHLTALRAGIWQGIGEDIAEMDCQEACLAPLCVPSIIIPDVNVCIPPICIGIGGEMFFKKLMGKIADALIGEPWKDVELAFKKLDSEKPIGTDYCCLDPEGNCRNENYNIDMSKIKEREYTLKEKLIKVQKLLNMARSLVGQQEQGTNLREESKYDLLLKNLIKLGLADKKELSYVLSTDKLDLNNCNIYFQTEEYIQAETPHKTLMNCWDVNTLDVIDINDSEACPPDPYLDCDFFVATTTRERNPINCLCYKEDADQSFYNKDRFPELYHTGLNISIPNLNSGIDLDNIFGIIILMTRSKIQINKFIGFGNNFYCCVKEHEE